MKKLKHNKNILYKQKSLNKFLSDEPNIVL